MASSLGECLSADYNAHPMFQFTDEPWELDPELLDVFARKYVLARECADRFRLREWLACRTEVQAALEAVFRQLQAQPCVEFETLFLEELRLECRRLLEEELELFRRERLTHSLSFENAVSRANAAKLLTQRYFFGELRPEAAAELLSIGSSDLDSFRAAAAQGRLKRQDLSIHQGPVIKRLVNFLNREFDSQGVLAAVSSYMGQRTRVMGIALELSVSSAGWWKSRFKGLARAPNTLYAHVDESIVFPKSIVYLSPVNESNGPTSVYPAVFDSLSLHPLQAIVGRVVGNVGSRPESLLTSHYEKQYHQAMSSELFRRHFMRLPGAIRFNSHFGWDVLPGSAVEALLERSERPLTGPAGTYVVFDGARLVHRGGLLQRGERVALQVIFAHTTLKKRLTGKLRRMLPAVRIRR
jgi:hypothetical protein